MPDVSATRTTICHYRLQHATTRHVLMGIVMACVLLPSIGWSAFFVESLFGDYTEIVAPTSDADGNFTFTITAHPTDPFAQITNEIERDSVLVSTTSATAGLAEQVSFSGQADGVYLYSVFTIYEGFFYDYSVADFIVVVGDDHMTTAPTASAADTVGTSPVVAAVGADGDANISIPIRTLPGVAGNDVGLALVYDSGRGIDRLEQRIPEDTIGYGWRLAGLSSIRRCVVDKPSTTSVALNSADSLCLDGMPLVLETGTHLKDGATYRTKIESFLKIEYQQDPIVFWMSGGVFRVTSPDGTVRRYGGSMGEATVDKLKSNGDAVDVVWHMYHQKDADDNFISYDYFVDAGNGVAYPVSILYSGAEVTFEYRTRTDADPVGIGELTQEQPVFLHTVNVFTDNTLVREYRLIDEVVSGHRRLNKVQECGYNESGTGIQCLKPIDIDWQTPASTMDGVDILVDKVTDGLGAVTEFQYQTLTSSSSSGTYSERPFGNHSLAADTQYLSGSGALRHVVTKLRRDNGLGGYFDTSYAYQNKGVESTKHWGFLGFHAVRIKDEQSGFYTYVQNRMDYPHFGSVAAVRSYESVYQSGSTPKLARRENQYTYKNVTRNSTTTKLPFSNRQTSFMYVNNTLVGGTENESDQTVTSGFVTAASSTRRVGESISENTASPSYWGDVKTHTLGGIVRTEDNTVEFNNRTSGSTWLIGFIDDVERTVYDGAIGGTGVTSVDLTAEYSPETGSNRLAESILFPGDPLLEAVTSYGYDVLGNLSQINQEGDSSSDDRIWEPSDILKYRYPQKITNPLGHESDLEYDLRYGTVDKITDPNNRVSTVTRDNFGRVKSSTNSDGVTVTTTFTDCSAIWCPTVGNAVVKYRVTTTSPIAPTVHRYFDNLGRQVHQLTKDFANTDWYRSQVRYDEQGRVEQQAIPSSTTGSMYYTVPTYDDYGRVERVDRPNGGYTTTGYTLSGSDLVVTVTDKVRDSGGSVIDTQKKVSTYNILGQLIETVDASGDPEATTTSFEYTPAGLVKKVTVDGGSAGSTKTTMSYDYKGRRRYITGPNIGTVETDYNEFDEVDYIRDNAGQVTTVSYDKLGRTTSRTSVDGTSTWTWDTATNGKGRLAWKRNYHGTGGDLFKETYSYGTDSKLSSVQTDIKVNGVTRTYTTQLSYDSYGRLNTSTSPSGFAIKSVYTGLGYLSQLQDNSNSASLVTINGLNAFGAVTKQTLGNGIVTDFGFDPKSGRLTSILSKKGTSTIQDLDYGWNTNATLGIRVANPDIGIGTLRQESMAYDALNRLEQATTELSGVWKRDLDTDYNKLGNITSHTSTKSGDDDVTAYGYGTDTDGNSSGTPGKHSVVSATINGVAYTMTYDENGAMDSIVQNGTTNGRYLQYNANNQPLFIVVGTSLLDLNPIAKDEFRYGPDGERYYRKSSYTEGGNAKTEEAFIVGGYEHTFITGDSVVKETKKSQAGSVLHVVATAPNNTVTTSIEYLLTDHLGSITRVTDASGNLLVTQQFEPFGARKDSDWLQNTDATELSTLLAGLKVHTNRGYTGHEHLDRTGFIHMNGRLFEPTIARFMSPDPHVQAPGYSQNWNRLSYVLNSPLSFTDPSGLDISLFADDYCAASYYLETYPTKEDAMDSRHYDDAASFWDGDCNPISWLPFWTIPGDEVTSWGTSTRTHVLGRNWNPQQGPLILWDSGPDMPFDMLPQMPVKLSDSPSSLRFSNVFSLCFFGKDLALTYIDKYDEDAWEQIRNDRDSTLAVVPGTESEAMRNAEHYLYARAQVTSNSYNWGPMIAATVGYNTWKFWRNVGEYYGVVESPWTYSVNTTDELKAGFAGANDALFGQDDDCGYR